MGVHIYQTPPVVSRKEVKLLSFAPLNNMTGTYRLVCENTGDVQVNCISYFELANLAGGNRIRIPAREIPMFPGQKRHIDLEVPAFVPNGKYTLTGVVDAGADVPLEAAQLLIVIAK